MASMEDEMLAGLAESIDSRLISAGTGLHLAAIADRLKRIGEQVLEIANQIAHLYAE